MGTLSYFWAQPVFQAPGTVAWNVPWGDRDWYWGFAARPFQANDTTVLERVSANHDNNLNNSTDVVVTMISGGGGLVRLTATRVTQ
ncbi:hypothetical protein [Embleya sp. NBC_00896]|uniref:hypothetical protein n=1 Tax=Embleya sp. NBC_00896 TaxID=2975961 RepID=UPI003865E79B|nr:hypothetical protein OG928_33970 [Embleya sp. NBC_00896]